MARVVPALGWLLLVLVAFGPWAPPGARPDQTAWLIRLVTGDWAGENPLVVAHFQLMGVWPLMCAVALRAEWRAGPVPAWPFLLGSFALGCFALLPWFVLRRPEPVRLAPRSRWLGGAAVALGAVGGALLGWGALAGDVGAFVAAIRSESFMWAMGWDFVAFSVLFPAIVGGRGRAAWWAWVPVVGPAAWLAVHHLRRDHSM